MQSFSTRRGFLRASAGLTAGALLGHLRDDWPARLSAAEDAVKHKSPDDTASDESFWFQIQQAFDIDRSVINLNNGGVCPSPRVVMDAQRRHLEYANTLPARNLWQVQDPQVEHVRTLLAAAFGCDTGEMAITRNASESLQIALNGIDLKPGDEFLTTTQDYPRMIHTINQRVLREGVVLKQIKLPIPPRTQDELVEAFDAAVTPKTRVLLVSHVINITGQIMPVQQLCEMARRRGLWSIVDGAHAFAQFPFDGGAIGCDCYGVSLHKWLTAPIGTGFLYVRKDRIAELWPLTAAEKPRSDDIRKFEEIGTHSDAPRLAIAEAMMFWRGIGANRKAARLRFLRDRWATRVMNHKKIRLHTNRSPEHSCAIGTVQIEGIDSGELTDALWKHHKIFVTPIKHTEFEGIRVTPNVYTTLEEVDLFSATLEKYADRGLPN
jgi:isopenicillin-N epimerase